VTPLQAVLLDLDGTLVDSEPAWHQAKLALTSRLGLRLGLHDLARTVGCHPSLWVPAWLGLARTNMAEREAYRILEAEVLQRLPMAPARPGARAMISALARHGIPMALVTSSDRSVVDAALLALGDVVRFIGTQVCAEDVTDLKPSPSPYLLATAELGVDPRACVAIEDSDIGGRAADAAGCVVVLLQSDGRTVPAGWTRRRSLADITLDDLHDILASHRP